ncbi:hypothetical protein [Nocardioides sp.]|uniref:hypothetical protein n=1 Tax=Nocardioides sp. TaxID=35761 RepID=UPI0035AD7AF7
MPSNALGSLRRGLPAIAVAALLVAAAATSGATAALVITGDDIKNNTVTTKDIKNATLTAQDVKDRSLSSKDLRTSVVEDLKGATGPAGPAGPPGIFGYQIVTKSVSLPPLTTTDVTATCPAGKRLLSAGGWLINQYQGAAVIFTETSATAAGYNDSDLATDTLTVQVVCAVVS